MVQFNTTIKRLPQQGHTVGWTYIVVPVEIAHQMVPGNKKGFRVKGYLDEYRFEKLSLIPFGGGDFILTLKAEIRKAIGKGQGAKVNVRMEVDSNPIAPPADLIECLSDEPAALERFNKITMSHRNYFINYINTAKTDATKAKRIASTVNALSRGWDFGQMIRSMKKDNDNLMDL